MGSPLIPVSKHVYDVFLHFCTWELVVKKLSLGLGNHGKNVVSFEDSRNFESDSWQNIIIERMCLSKILETSNDS